MGTLRKALFVGAAILVASASADAHMSGMGGRPAGGFHGFGRPTPGLQLHRPNFHPAFPGVRFGRTRSEGWDGGAYSAGVAGFEDDEDDDFAPEDLHFRVQESFGPGDIGRRPPPPESYDEGPWNAARMDPWHGYEPDNQ